MSQRKAFLLYAGQDTGGTAIRSVQAFQKVQSDWSVHSMIAAQNYIQYEEDIPYSRTVLEQLYDDADVVHSSHTPITHDWYDAGQGKPTVLMHHGVHTGMFSYDLLQAIERGIELGMTQTGSTANLELFGPPGTILWTPSPYDLAKLAEMRRMNFKPLDLNPNRPIRIGHAPTDRKIKSTEAFLAAIIELKRRKLPIEAVFIEKQTNFVCLERKSTCDIFVDQLVLGYGQNAIEAWGMGIPVVGNIQMEGWYRPMTARWGSQPLFEATEANLADRLETLVRSPRLREDYTQKGLDHVRRWHAQEVHVAQMAEVYANARPTRPSSNELTRRLSLPGQPIVEPRTRLAMRTERLNRLALKGKLN